MFFYVNKFLILDSLSIFQSSFSLNFLKQKVASLQFAALFIHK